MDGEKNVTSGEILRIRLEQRKADKNLFQKKNLSIKMHFLVRRLYVNKKI